jgi:uncharacterized membrane protein
VLGFDSNVTNSLIHLYRGEMGRMTLYRVRLDTTTNWAIVTTAGVVTFAFGNEAVPHAVFLFAMLLVYAFLHFESRRFVAYELAHQRVRLLERFFYHEMLSGEADPEWRQRLLASLARPQSPISRIDAIGWRLRRNYLWIFGGLIVAWVVKLDSLSDQTGVVELVARAAIGPLPGGAVVALVALFYLVLIGLAVYASRDYPLEAE